jgi:hypothetical protein
VGEQIRHNWGGGSPRPYLVLAHFFPCSCDPFDLIKTKRRTENEYVQSCVTYTQIKSRIKIATKSANWVSLPRINFRANIFHGLSIDRGWFCSVIAAFR